MNLLLQFFYLQALDFLTTLAFLTNGVQEGNPLVRLLISVSSPLTGVLAAKLGAIILGLTCWRLQKHRALSRINIFYAVVVAWNVVAILLSAPALAAS